MGVSSNRILEDSRPFEKINDWNIKPPAGDVNATECRGGVSHSHRVNDAFIALNRCWLRMKNILAQDVRWCERPHLSAGALYSPQRLDLPALQKASADLGVSFACDAGETTAGRVRLRRPRIGLWDQYGGSMEADGMRGSSSRSSLGSTEFPPVLDVGNLNDKYDVLIFVEGGIPTAEGDGRRTTVQGHRKPASPPIGNFRRSTRPSKWRVTAASERCRRSKSSLRRAARDRAGFGGCEPRGSNLQLRCRIIWFETRAVCRGPGSTCRLGASARVD